MGSTCFQLSTNVILTTTHRARHYHLPRRGAGQKRGYEVKNGCWLFVKLLVDLGMLVEKRAETGCVTSRGRAGKCDTMALLTRRIVKDVSPEANMGGKIQGETQNSNWFRSCVSTDNTHLEKGKRRPRQAEQT